MRQLQLVAHGEPSDVIELNTVFEPAFDLFRGFVKTVTDCVE
jgi:hypothetical protein